MNARAKPAQKRPTAKRTPRRPRGARAPVDVPELLQLLHKHAMNEIKLTPTQVRAAEVVLDRYMPDIPAAKRRLPPRDWMGEVIEHKKRSAWHAAHRTTLALGKKT